MNARIRVCEFIQDNQTWKETGKSQTLGLRQFIKITQEHKLLKASILEDLTSKKAKAILLWNIPLNNQILNLLSAPDKASVA